jgi:hypothetical protein
MEEVSLKVNGLIDKGVRQMPVDSIVCRRVLDEERGNPWICEYPMCQRARGTEKSEGEGKGRGESSSPGASYEAAEE